MGLDMYLEKDLYVGKRLKGTQKLEWYDGYTEDVNLEEIVKVTQEVGYWRKANAIHNWFVQQCGGGVDECQRMPVSQEKLQTLLALVNQVLLVPEMAPELLPTTDGFFFGSTEYDEGYLEDLKNTQKILTDVLLNWDENPIYYQASW